MSGRRLKENGEDISTDDPRQRERRTLGDVCVGEDSGHGEWREWDRLGMKRENRAGIIVEKDQ